jgi:hypothetical protein
MKITGIDNMGTIVQVFVDERPFVINMDHRMYWQMHEAEEGNILGRKIKVHGDEFNQTIEFVN